MKRINTILAITFLMSINGLSQEISETVNANLVIKLTFLPFLQETVVHGKIILTKDSLFFSAAPCNDLFFKKAIAIFPCNAHLIKPIGLSFKDIEKIKRRAFLFLIPNRIFIQTKNKDSYLFIANKRRMIIRKYKSYLVNLDEQSK